MGKNFDIYVGEVMGEPRILVIGKYKAVNNLNKAIEKSKKYSAELNKIMHEKIVERFVQHLNDNGYIRMTNLTDYLLIASDKEVDWADKNKQHLVLTPESHFLNALLPSNMAPTKAVVFFDVEKWY